MVLKCLITTALVASFFLPIDSKLAQRVKLGKSLCSMDSVAVTSSADETVELADAETNIVGMVAEIVRQVGLQQNFTIKSYGRFNAEAVIINSRRYIVYNSDFLNEVKEKGGGDWAIKGVLAHEVGHHLKGHTLEFGDARTLEKEADEFAGFILYKMGATLQEAESGIEVLSADIVRPGSSHPSRRDRVKAVKDGWNKARSLQRVIADNASRASNAFVIDQASFAPALKQMLSTLESDFTSIRGAFEGGTPASYVSRVNLPGMRRCTIFPKDSETTAFMSCWAPEPTDSANAESMYQTLVAAVRSSLDGAHFSESFPTKGKRFVANKGKAQVRIMLNYLERTNHYRVVLFVERK